MKFYIRDDYQSFDKFTLCDFSEFADNCNGHSVLIKDDTVLVPDYAKVRDGLNIVAYKKYEILDRITPIKHSLVDFKVKFVPIESIIKL